MTDLARWWGFTDLVTLMCCSLFSLNNHFLLVGVRGRVMFLKSVLLIVSFAFVIMLNIHRS